MRTILLAIFGAVLLCGSSRAADSVKNGSYGELIYVPIYSSIYFQDNKRTTELAATLSVHNVDPDLTLTIQRVDYYNTAGKLIRHYLDVPLVLQPLETKNFVVDKADTSGGTGANFLIEWRSDKLISSPIAEALMISLSSGQGISFTSVGKVVRHAESPSTP